MIVLVLLLFIAVLGQKDPKVSRESRSLGNFSSLRFSVRPSGCSIPPRARCITTTLRASRRPTRTKTCSFWAPNPLRPGVRTSMCAVTRRWSDAPIPRLCARTTAPARTFPWVLHRPGPFLRISTSPRAHPLRFATVVLSRPCHTAKCVNLLRLRVRRPYFSNAIPAFQ